MKDRNIVIKLLQLLSIILLYYIVKPNNLFLYVITLSLYNIYSACFKHITLKEKLKNINDDYNKSKITKYIVLTISVICLFFVLLSILISDTINILLNIENVLLPYVIMSISVIAEPLIKVLLEYLESYNRPKLCHRLLNTYHILEIIFLLIISVMSIKIFKLPMHLSVALMYLSKIISCILISIITYLVLKKQKETLSKNKDDIKINYKQEIKDVIKTNSHKSIIYLMENSYYYISIIVLYMILSTKYSYNINLIEKEINFIYLYALTIIKFIIDMVLSIIKNNDKNKNIISYILNVFKFMITISIILAITSPLVCKIIFNDSTNSIYLMMLSFLSIFIALFKVTFDSLKNKKLIYTSLIIGIISKTILIVPLINSFYRMGYNLIYGDIISSIISMLISVIINYIYLKNKNKKEKTLDKILTTLYESMLLCIILVILQFIIPIKSNNYFISIIIFAVYISVSIIFLKLKKKKRG